MTEPGTIIRALLLGEGLDLKGLERQDAFSANPLAFTTSGSGTAMLFKFGAVVFFNMTPIEEEGLIRGLEPRIQGPLGEREVETALIATAPDEENLLSKSGAIQLKATDPDRLLLVGEALAVSVALAYDERRIATAVGRDPVPVRQEPRQRRRIHRLHLATQPRQRPTAPPAARPQIGDAGADRRGSPDPEAARLPRGSRREARRALGPSRA